MGSASRWSDHLFSSVMMRIMMEKMSTVWMVALTGLNIVCLEMAVSACSVVTAPLFMAAYSSALDGYRAH